MAMDDKNDEFLVMVVQEQLARLGVDLDCHVKKNYSSRSFGLNSVTNSAFSKSSKVKGKSSPRKCSASLSPAGSGRSLRNEIRKYGYSKSPFSSARKRHNDQEIVPTDKKRTKPYKKAPFNFDKHAPPLGKVFGQPLESMPRTSVFMADGTQVIVPEFLVDACEIIRHQITLEGIFRKAGSSQRQNDAKKLLNAGVGLPSSLHPVDAACLVKQFLRCLPSSLFPLEIHTMMTRCLDLDKSIQGDAIMLCTLLLPCSHQHLLLYLVNFLSEVVKESKHNRMDAFNLAVVLAPNVLPHSVTGSYRKGLQHGSLLQSEDSFLTSSIDIMQLLIENADSVCRIPRSVSDAIEEHEKTHQPMENLSGFSSAPTSSQQKKKRRSAPIQRFVTGLRRVVGQGSLSNSAYQQPANTLDGLDLHVADSKHSSNLVQSPSPNKRKSDTFDADLDGNATGDNVVGETHPKKKQKMNDLQINSAVAPKIVITSPENSDGQGASSFYKRHSLGLSSQHMCRSADASSRLSPSEHRAESEIFSTPSSVLLPLKPSQRQAKVERHKSCSACHSEPEVNYTRPRRRASELPVLPSYPFQGKQNNDKEALHPSFKKQQWHTDQTQTPTGIRQRSVLQTRKPTEVSSFYPDGSELATLGSRGVPDGAESNPRDSGPCISSGSGQKGAVAELESQYATIKLAVQSMEDAFDHKNVQQMKEHLFNEACASLDLNLSCADMIQTAYERMKVGTKNLDASPSENMTQRFGKELQLCRRRSAENQVVRSPSERKIGTVRRRSKETAHNTAKTIISCENMPASETFQTPVIKNVLMQTPANGALRRGKPNSLRSGLPLIARPVQLDTPETPGLHCSSSFFVSGQREALAKSVDGLSSDYEDSNNSINIVPGNYSGPLTRRRSSILSQYLSNSAMLDNIELLNSKQESEKSICGSSSVDMSDFKFIETLGHINNSEFLTNSAVVSSDEGEDWVEASEFVNHINIKGSTPYNEGATRPSIAALMKQKKVTTNVQLFNNLQSASPRTRQHARSQCTPQCSIPMHSAFSENKALEIQPCFYTSATPFNSRKQRNLLADKTKAEGVRVAVVTPLREINSENVQDITVVTPKIPKYHSREIFKTPTLPVTLLHAKDKPPLPEVGDAGISPSMLQRSVKSTKLRVL